MDSFFLATNMSQYTIIIPAYNEAAIIAQTLKPFLENDFLDNNQVIVVCNGCHDETAKIVSQLSPKFVCIETDIPSKTNALNMGDEVAKFYPRIYLDADIVISVEAVKAIVETLNRKNVFATSVAPKMDFSGCSWCVKAYYAIWLQLPYCKEGMMGGGNYALNEKGRQRFDKFPSVIVDDAFVRCHFTEQERPLTTGGYAIVKAPKDFFSLIKIKTRGRLGLYQLNTKFPELILLNNEKKDYKQAIKSLFFNYRLWPQLIIYITVTLIGKIRAFYQKNYTNKNLTIWERDESNRSVFKSIN